MKSIIKRFYIVVFLICSIIILSCKKNNEEEGPIPTKNTGTVEVKFEVQGPDYYNFKGEQSFYKSGPSTGYEQYDKSQIGFSRGYFPGDDRNNQSSMVFAFYDGIISDKKFPYEVKRYFSNITLKQPPYEFGYYSMSTERTNEKRQGLKIVILSLKDQRIKGTFKGSLYGNRQDSIIVNGTFDVKLIKFQDR
ncbi:hypothetical protein LT679_09910 [Mucilaginibacter roseus]|uniref:Lipoprotein n=1 Tax=Mucilaginibacter roseus TaxID=1528868 RepID=A0ABS8U487_9SPHI|nr:hypothetical protein [Mucilaginibacter roseus]MCD8740915.1 hypothetical protein [Mucilaginibacter roseus]